MSVDPDFLSALKGSRLTTAEVFYHMPDHPGLLQTFLWQTYDVAPDYPRLMQFLDYWKREIEAVIHSVRVAHAELVKPVEWRGADVQYLLN
ncbi:MAG: usg protein [Oceanicaulis sp.]